MGVSHGREDREEKGDEFSQGSASSCLYPGIDIIFFSLFVSIIDTCNSLPGFRGLFDELHAGGLRGRPGDQKKNPIRADENELEQNSKSHMQMGTDWAAAF